MNKNKKLPLYIFGGLAVLAFIVFLLGLYASNRIENRISDVLKEKASYEKIDVDLWQKDFSISGLRYKENDRSIYVRQLVLKDLQYWEYFTKDKIIVQDLVLQEPEIQLRDRENRGPLVKPGTLKKEILIKNLEATAGTFRLLSPDGEKNALFVSFPELQLSGFKVDSSIVRQKIPFEYASYRFLADSVRLNLDAEHFIAAAQLQSDPQRTQVKDFRIIPYFTKTEFDRTVGYEKDRISLRVDSINLRKFRFEYLRDTLHLSTPLVEIGSANLEVYRNRLLPDTLYVKPLYSQLVRNAPVKMDLEKVELGNSQITYEEVVRAGRPAAKVGFYEINGEVRNITNMNLERKDFPRTRIDLNANFLNTAPVAIDWSFDINNLEDKFLFAGDFGRVPATALNDFLVPAMNLQAEGALNSVDFTFSGDDDAAVGDVRIQYDQFRIQLLEEEGRDEKEFLSAIANLFVDNDGLSEEDVVKDLRVERNPYRSFWSYIWSGVKKGLREGLSQL